MTGSWYGAVAKFIKQCEDVFGIKKPKSMDVLDWYDELVQIKDEWESDAGRDLFCND